MTRIAMIGCRKGGVTKTTTTINLAFELSQKGKKVLILDFDGQGDTTKFFKRVDTEFFVGDALLDRKFDITKAIYKAIVDDKEQENLHIIPGRRGDIMTKLDIDMISLTRREERLKTHLEKIQHLYDFILIDTNPGTSVLGLNAVIAANEFLFPTEFKDRSLDGVETLLEHIQETTFVDEEDIKFLVIPSKIDKRERKNFDYGMSYLQGRWPNNMSKNIIWQRTIFSESEMAYEPVSVINPSHEAAQYYKNLAEEVLSRD